MQKKQPQMLGIGAHKAGTSWLTKQLINHPEIWITPIKELHFFDRSLNYPSPNRLATSSPLSRIFGSQPWERKQTVKNTKTIAKHLKAGRFRDALWWSKWTFGYYSESWYKGLFSQAESYQVSGEITPAYSILEVDDIARIKAVNPDIKLIYMIRNPIDRAWSAVRFNINQSKLNIDVSYEDKIISALQSRRMVLRGDYERTLDNYLRYFDSSQILVCFYDAIQANPIGLMSEITNFLNILPFEDNTVNNQTFINASPSHEMPSRVKDYLTETYAPMIQRLAKRFGSYAKNWEKSLISDKIAQQKFDLNSYYFPALTP